MRLWRLFIFSLLLLQKAYCTQAIAPSHQKYDHLTPDSIDKLNARAQDIYLADPVYGRKLASDALLASKIINYNKGIGQSFLNISYTYWSQSYYPISLLYTDTAMRYLGKNDKLLYSECYKHMGRVYADMKDYRSAAYYLDKARVLAGADPGSSLNVMVEMSYLYYKRGDFVTAYNTTVHAMKLCRALKDTGTEAILYSRFASMYFVQKQYAKTLGYCDTAIRLSYVVNNKRLRCASFVERSTILLDQNNTAGALQYALHALAICDTLGIMDLKKKSYLAIIAAYEVLKDSKNLLSYEKEFNQFLQQRSTIDKQSNSQLMRDYFELNSELQDISLMKQNAREDDMRIKTQQQVITILVISLLIVITALYIVWFYYNQKNKLAQQLRDQYIATLTQSQIIENQSRDLEELNNFKSKLLAIIGHDLRAPINNLRNVTDMFEDGSFTIDEVHLLMKNINPVVKGAELTLSNLLVWADGQIRGIKPIKTTPVDLFKVIEEAEEICRSNVDKKHIRIKNNVAMDAFALVDENHLKVIISNLVSNAVKFTEDGGHITVSADRDGEKLVVSVSDTGIGMSAEDMEKLMSVSTHFSKPGTQGETGTGIGLLLCRELIEINGGKLWLTSDLGEGTTFYFSLPSAALEVA